jgi:hypothetical protein
MAATSHECPKWRFGNWDGLFEALERNVREVRDGGEAPGIAALSGSLPPRLWRGIFADLKAVAVSGWNVRLRGIADKILSL